MIVIGYDTSALCCRMVVNCDRLSRPQLQQIVCQTGQHTYHDERQPTLKITFHYTPAPPLAMPSAGALSLVLLGEIFPQSECLPPPPQFFPLTTCDVGVSLSQLTPTCHCQTGFSAQLRNKSAIRNSADNHEHTQSSIGLHQKQRCSDVSVDQH